MVPAVPPPKIARPTSEIAVFVSDGSTSSRNARYESPRNIRPSVDPIHISVVLAFFHSGGRNAGTPFEMASTPVTAAPPDAKACRIRNSEMGPVVRMTSVGGTGCRPPVSARKSPRPRRASIIAMKK